MPSGGSIAGDGGSGGERLLLRLFFPLGGTSFLLRVGRHGETEELFDCDYLQRRFCHALTTTTTRLRSTTWTCRTTTCAEGVERRGWGQKDFFGKKPSSLFRVGQCDLAGRGESCHVGGAGATNNNEAGASSGEGIIVISEGPNNNSEERNNLTARTTKENNAMVSHSSMSAWGRIGYIA